MKKALSSLSFLLLCVLIVSNALATSTLSVGVPTPTGTFYTTESYASGKYYTNLIRAIESVQESDVKMSPADYYIKIAQSQVGYTGGSKAGQYSGSGGGNKFTEYARFIKGKDASYDWCASFVSWCAAAAGFSSKTVMPRSALAGAWKSPSVGEYKALWNKDFTQYQSSVDIQAGDLVMFFPSDYKGSKNSDGTYKVGRTKFTAYFWEGANKGKTATHDPKTGADNCGWHYLSHSGTSHVAIVEYAVPLNENGKAAKSGEKIAAYEVHTIERTSGNKVGRRTIVTNKGYYRACSHIYGSNKTIPAIVGRYRPNWSAAKTWAPLTRDAQKPVLNTVSTSNITSAGCDLFVSATDNVGVTGYRIDVWANGERQYDQILSVPSAKSSSKTFHFNWSQFKAGLGVNYHFFAYPIDASGNRGDSKAVYAFADSGAPENVTVYTENVTRNGYDLIVQAEDPSGIASVQILIEGNGINRYDVRHEADGSKQFRGTYHIDFVRDYSTFDENIQYTHSISVTDTDGNTAEPVHINVFADTTPPTVIATGFENEDESGFDVRYVVKDNVEIASIEVDIYCNGEYLETTVDTVSGYKTYEGGFRYSYPLDPENTEIYTGEITITDSSGNMALAVGFDQSVVRSAPDTLPKDYFQQDGSWEYVLSNGRFYITGPADPEACASVTKLMSSDFPSELIVNGIPYQFAGTKASSNPEHSFASLPNLQEIEGFPATTEIVGGFNGCKALRRVIISSDIISSDAFAGCSNLSEVKLSRFICSIGENAFAGCSQLAEIQYEGTPDEWANVTVSGALPEVICRINITSKCSNSTYDKKLGVITAVFTNDGYLGDATFWRQPIVDIMDEEGNRLGFIEGEDLSYTGKTCTIFFDLEKLQETVSLQYDTKYRYRVYLQCAEYTIQSDEYALTTWHPVTPDVPVREVILDKAGRNLTKGETVQLYAACFPADATDKSVTWSSSNPSVATVSGGLVTAKAVGTAQIKCLANYSSASGGNYDICYITVTDSCTSCSTQYAGWYKVTGTPGNLAISSIHNASTSSGATELGKIPEGKVVWVSKATGYNGQGQSSGKYGHVTYKGVGGFSSMNYLEKLSGTTVTLDLNGGYAPAGFYGTTVTLWNGATGNNTITNRIPARDGYDFDGWYLNASGTGQRIYDEGGFADFDNDYWVNGDGGLAWGEHTVTKLYAGWVPRYYKVYFDPAGGANALFSQDMIFGDTRNNIAPVPSRAGYSFLGWYTAGGTQLFDENGKWNSTGGYYFTSDGKWRRDNDVTVTARWAEADTTPPVIRDVYVFDRTANGYTISFIVEDDVALETAYIESWTEVEGEANAVRGFVVFIGSHASAWVTAEEHSDGVGAVYTTRIVARDTAGNEDIRILRGDNAVYLDAEPPVVSQAQITDVQTDGFQISVHAADDDVISSVKCLAWAANETPPEEESWLTAKEFEQDEEDRWVLGVSLSEGNPDSGLWNVAVRAWDSCGNVSSEQLLSVDVGQTDPSETLRICAYGNHVYILMSPVSRTRSGAAASAVWDASQLLCKSFGGHLIKIDSAEENAFASSLAEEFGAPVWIGAKNDGEWKWTDGSGLSYKHWASEQPGQETIAALRPDGEWISEAETPDQFYGILCEIDDNILALPNVKSIGQYAFHQNAAQIVVIPESCEEIGKKAFAEANCLAYVLLPEGIDFIDIEDDAFEDVYYLTY